MGTPFYRMATSRSAPAAAAASAAAASSSKPPPPPKAPTIVVAASSSKPPPPPPGAGRVKKTQQFNIARKPRPQTVTRPLVPTASITGVKRKPTSDLNYAGRPPQPAAPSAARGTKRGAGPLIRPGRPVQPAGPSIDDLQMPPKAKKVDTPPRRPNQKRGSDGGGAYRERLNNKSSRVVVR